MPTHRFYDLTIYNIYCELSILSETIIIFFPMAQQPLVGQGFLSIEISLSQRLVQHTTFTRDRHPCPGRIRTRNPSKRAAADSRLRPRGHWDRPVKLS